ncbi:hypothetical protein [Marinobacter salinus]|nr:hypothetical protein [Marinobacter salinus]
MKTMHYLGKGLVGVCLFVALSATQASEGESGYMYCEADYRWAADDEYEVYISNVFYVSSFYDDEVSDSYKKFIDARYDPSNPAYNVTCEYNLFETAREAKDRRNEAISEWRSTDFDVHEVKWSY